jgi:hypothetical protein
MNIQLNEHGDLAEEDVKAALVLMINFILLWCLFAAIGDWFKTLKLKIERWKRNIEDECNRLGEPKGLWKIEWPKFKKWSPPIELLDLRSIICDNDMKAAKSELLGITWKVTVKEPLPVKEGIHYFADPFFLSKRNND